MPAFSGQDCSLCTSGIKSSLSWGLAPGSQWQGFGTGRAWSASFATSGLFSQRCKRCATQKPCAALKRRCSTVLRSFHGVPGQNGSPPFGFAHRAGSPLRFAFPAEGEAAVGMAECGLGSAYGSKSKGSLVSDPLKVLVRAAVTEWIRSRIPRLLEEARGCTSSSCCGVPTRADGSTGDTGRGSACIRARPARTR
jgi:hypothetical protein